MRKSTAELKPKVWRERRDKLQAALRDTAISPSRILNGTFYLTLEGGRFPATYDLITQKLTIWSRVSRWAGGSVTIEDLQHVEETLKKWQREDFSE
jgi:hypothetical protein